MYRLLGVVLAFEQVGGQRVQLHHGAAAVQGVVAGDQQSGQQVAQDAGHGLQLVERDGAAVHRARGLPSQPLLDAARAERVLTLRSLYTVYNI